MVEYVSRHCAYFDTEKTIVWTMRECFLGLMTSAEVTQSERKDVHNQVVSNMKKILLQIQESNPNNYCLKLDFKYLRMKFCLEDKDWQEKALEIVKEGLQEERGLYSERS